MSDTLAGKPRYLLSGASGMLGRSLQQALAARSVPFLQLVRLPLDSPNQVQWNPAAQPGESAVAQPVALEGFTAAIQLSGASLAAHRWTPAYKREMTASR